jgi:hypothetical protein
MFFYYFLHGMATRDFNSRLYIHSQYFYGVSSDGILGHHFNKRFESFAPCYLHSLLLANFKKTLTYSSLVLIILTKESAKQENSSLFMNSILFNGKQKT